MTPRKARLALVTAHLVGSLLIAAGPIAAQPAAVAEPAAPAVAAAPTMVPVAILPFQDRGGDGGLPRVAGAPAGDGGKVTDLLFAELVAARS